MEKLRVGIIGQGRSGWGIHGRALTERLRDYFTLAAVCDLLPERCIEARSAVDCAVHTDYIRMIDEVPLDLVVNVTRSDDHERINLDLLARGRNVLSDKPLAATLASFDRQTEAAARAGRRFFAFQQSRFAPGFLKVREVIASGVLGRIVMVKVFFNGFARRWDWQTLREYMGGSLLNTGPHPVDQALQFYGDGDADPETVCCVMEHTDNTVGDAEDHVKLLLSGRGHPTVDVEISSCAAYSPHLYQVYGARGGLVGDYKQQEWKYYRTDEVPAPVLVRDPMPERKYCTETLPWYRQTWEASSEATDFQTWTRAFYIDLHRAMTENAEPVVRLDQVRRQVRIIEECRRQNSRTTRNTIRW